MSGPTEIFRDVNGNEWHCWRNFPDAEDIYIRWSEGYIGWVWPCDSRIEVRCGAEYLVWSLK